MNKYFLKKIEFKTHDIIVTKIMLTQGNFFLIYYALWFIKE
jgi:hypothetical protein